MNMSKLCQDEAICVKPANFSCHHCPQKLCLEHLLLHNKLNITRVGSLLNTMAEFMKHVSNFNTQNSSENARNKLETWKEQMFDAVLKIYESRSNQINSSEIELKERLNLLKEYMESIYSNLRTQLLGIQNIGEVSEQVLLPIEDECQKLEQFFESIKCELSIDIKNVSLNDSVDVYNTFSFQRPSFQNFPIKPYKILSVPGLKKFVTSKTDESILWLDNQKLLHHINRSFQIRLFKASETLISSSAVSSDHSIKINDFNIVDMKWCSFTKEFLILLARSLFSYNYKTDKFTQICIKRYKNHPFRSIACFSNTLIYVSYCVAGVCLELWKYSYDDENSICMNECIKCWSFLTENRNEWISYMDINCNSQIGLLICRELSIYRRFELRDQNMHLLRTIQLDNDYVGAFFPYHNNYWFIKTLSGKYYKYSVKENACDLSSFEFPFGLQEFGINSLAIGVETEKLIICDFGLILS